MDISSMLAELRSEREQLDEAIMALERLARGGGKRRGRPPKWMSEAKTSDSADESTEAGGSKKRGRKKRVVSAEARAKMAAAQKRRWAAARKEAAS